MLITRRKFLKFLGRGVVLLLGLPWVKKELLFSQKSPRRKRTSASRIVVVEGVDPYRITLKALEMIGGIKRFVKRGDVVVIKPNMAWNRTPEEAANTNPLVVKALVEASLQAGARKVRVFDRTVNQARMSYERSGIAQAAREAGAEVSFINPRKFRKIKIPQGQSLKSWPIYRDALEADVFINVPIAKHHSLTRLTLGIKNILGVVGGNRGLLHPDIHQNLADLNSVIPIHLTVMDAFRILVRHGPGGGRKEDVKLTRKVIVGTDRVAVDAYTTGLFDLTPQDVKYIVNAHRMGLGEIENFEVEKENL